MRSPRSEGVRDGCELSCGCWNSGRKTCSLNHISLVPHFRFFPFHSGHWLLLNVEPDTDVNISCFIMSLSPLALGVFEICNLEISSFLVGSGSVG